MKHMRTNTREYFVLYVLDHLMWCSSMFSDELVFRLKNTINILMVLDQIGGSFELTEQIGEIFFFYCFGYLPEFRYSASFCISMVDFYTYIFVSISGSVYAQFTWNNVYSFLLECSNTRLSLASDLVWIGHCLCQIFMGCQE